MASTVNHFERFTDRLTNSCFSSTGKRIGVLICFSILVVLSARHPWPDLDLFTRAAVGRLTFQLGTAPSQDPFSFLADKPVWHDHEWLAGLLFYGVSRIGHGDAALFLLNLLFAAITLVVIAYVQHRVGVRPGTALILGFVTLPLVWFIWPTAIRAQVFTYLGYTLLLLAFVEARFHRRARWLFALPLIMVVWVNSHGGFVVGMAAVAIFAAIVILERRSPVNVSAGLSFVGCCGALLVNPYGISFLEFIFGAVSNPPTLIPEWGPPPIGSYFWQLFLVLCLGAAGAWRQVPKEGLALLLLSAHLGFSHRRFVPFLALTTAVYGAPLLEHAYQAVVRRIPFRPSAVVCRSVMVVLCMLAIALVALASKILALDIWNFRFDLHRYPVAALEEFRELFPPGRVLTHYNDGSYALWRLYPKFKISLDGRFDGVFTPDALEQGGVAYLENHPDQRKVLSSLDPDYVLTGLSLSGDCTDENGPRRRLFPGYDLIVAADRFCVLQRSSGEKPPVLVPRSAKVPTWKPLF